MGVIGHAPDLEIFELDTVLSSSANGSWSAKISTGLARRLDDLEVIMVPQKVGFAAKTAPQCSQDRMRFRLDPPR